MFVRWKQGAYNFSAFLIESVRIKGQPRQRIMTHLCIFRTGWMEEEQPDQWGRAELDPISETGQMDGEVISSSY